MTGKHINFKSGFPSLIQTWLLVGNSYMSEGVGRTREMCLMPAVVLSLFTILAHASTDGPLSLSDQDRAGKCHDQGQECVIITSCGDLLGLLPLVGSWVGSAAHIYWLLQVKTGNQKAQSSWC